MIQKNVENIVAIAELNQQLPLQTLSVSIPNSEYSEEDSLLIFRYEQPKQAVLLTEQGTISSTGSTSVEQAKELLYNTIKILQTHAIPIETIPEINIHNFVLSAQVDKNIDLDYLMKQLQPNLTIYKPERNPWIEYLFNEQITFLIHSSGKIICIGSGSMDQAHQAFEGLMTSIN